MFSRLLQVDAIAGAIERHFALLATALRADASVYGRAKALFFSLLTNRATHEYWSPWKHYDMQDRMSPHVGLFSQGVGNCDKSAILERQDDGKADFYGLFGS
jgi:hypothetical protein